MRPPKLIKPYVRRFCRRVEPEGVEPVYISSQPLPMADIGECFITVAQQVEREGGEQVIGWAIWEWPRVLIEAEFHAVWQTPAGELVNITPYPDPVPRLLFLPSVHRRYEGRSVDNVRQPLDRDPLIKRLVELCDLTFAEIDRGKVVNQHGDVAVRPQTLRYQKEHQAVLQRLHARYGRADPEE